MRPPRVPAYHMNQTGPQHLRANGILVMPFMESVRDDPRRLHPHVHEFYQMYLLHGRARLMLDFNEHAVGGDTAVFISPGQVHTVEISKDLDGVTLSFTREFYDDEGLHASSLLNLPFFLPDKSPPWLALTGEGRQEIIDLYHELLKEFNLGRQDSGEILRALLHLLLLKLRRLAEVSDSPAQTSRAKHLAREFQWLVEQRFSQEQRLSAYARLLGVTENHLNDTVRAITGQAAGEIIRRRRLLHAKRALLHSHQSVAEIGYELGFDDPSYFARFFRRYEKRSPTQFREQIRKKYQ